MGLQGEQTGAVYKITIGRVTICSSRKWARRSTRAMGLNTWAAFVGAEREAAIAGDVAMLAGEVMPVEGAAQERHRRVAIHHHMIGTQPTIYFLHYWGTGPAEKLAAAFESALAELGKSSEDDGRQGLTRHDDALDDSPERARMNGVGLPVR